MMNVRERIFHFAYLCAFCLSFSFQSNSDLMPRYTESQFQCCLHWIVREYFINASLWFERARCVVFSVLSVGPSGVFFFGECAFSFEMRYLLHLALTRHTCDSMRSIFCSVFFCTGKRYINCNEHSVFSCQFCFTNSNQNKHTLCRR